MSEPSARYAQTNLQLYRQLQEDGHRGAALADVRRAYELAARLFTGTYRPSGKANVDHLVGTASILSRLGLSAGIVAAGLLHPAYSNGDLGGLTTGMTRAARATVRHAVGPEVEEWVARYTALRSRCAKLSEFRDAFATLDPMDRVPALIRLADVLEDHLDHGILYCPNAGVRQETSRRVRPALVEMAGALGYPVLARELDRVLTAVGAAEVPPGLRGTSARVFSIAPRSYRLRLRVVVGRGLARAGRRVLGRLPAGPGRASRPPSRDD